MARLLSIAAAVCAAVVVTAAPAVAQRDPFDPLVSEVAATGGATGDTTGATGETEPAAAEEPQPTGAENLPDTGVDATSWLGVAFALLCAGAAAVVAARSFGPPPAAGRQRP